MPAHVQPSSPARSKPETLRLGPFGGSRAVLERLCLNTRIHYIAGTPRPQRAGGSPTCPTARRSRQSPGPWALAGRPPQPPLTSHKYGGALLPEPKGRRHLDCVEALILLVGAGHLQDCLAVSVEDLPAAGGPQQPPCGERGSRVSSWGIWSLAGNP